MKTEYVLLPESQNQINRLNERLAEIELDYAEKILRFPFDEKRIREDSMNNPNIKRIQQAINDIYMISETRILFTFETEEKKMFKNNLGLRENSYENSNA